MIGADESGQIQILDLATQAVVAQLQHGSMVYQLVYDAEQQLLFSAADDGTVARWQLFLETQNLIDVAKQLMLFPLDSAERQRFFLE